MVTIKDVAVDAGVSTATVSRVLNGDKKVLDVTKDAVTKSVEKLGYRVYPAARNLKKGKSHAIGVIVPELSNYFFMQLFEYFEQTLRENGYSMILCTSNDSVEEEMEMLNYLQSQFVEGIIAIPVSLEYDHFEKMAKHIPFVFVDRSFPSIKADSVLVNNLGGAFDAVTALIDDGFKNIAFIGGDENAMTSNERYTGYRAAMEKAHLTINEDNVLMTGTSMEDGYEAMDRILKRRLLSRTLDRFATYESPDAFFCVNLMVLHGATKRVMEESHAVQKSIVGAAFDEIFYANLFSWCKYFVSQPVREMGESAVRLMLERIDNEKKSDYKEVRLETKLLSYSDLLWKHA